MYPLIPPTTGLEGGLQLTVKDEGGPELENVILMGPGAGGITVYSILLSLEKNIQLYKLCGYIMVNFHNKSVHTHQYQLTIHFH